MQNHPNYTETMPTQLRPMIEDIAEQSKGAPWYAAYDHARGLWEMADAVFPDDLDEAQKLHSYMVAAILELMGADPRRATDPFQAAVYRLSARKDFRKAANKYLRKIGGKDAIEAKMQEWAEANPVLVKELAGSRGMPVSYADKVAPRSAEEAVPALMETAEGVARANMKMQGRVPPFFFAESRDGQQFLAQLNPRLPRRTTVAALRALAGEMDWHAGVHGAEVWMSDETDVLPSQSEQRQEAVVLAGLAEDMQVCAIFDIERSVSGVELRHNEDWKDGRYATLWAAVFDDDLYESLVSEPTVN